MSGVIIPRWTHLTQVLSLAEARITLFAPFFSEVGIQAVKSHIPNEIDLTFWTRLSLHDWANGVANPIALRTLMNEVIDAGNDAVLKIQPVLHAKAYFADESAALIGSANLTHGGFAHNVEVMFRLDGDEAAYALEALSSCSEPRSKQLSLAELTDWIERYEDRVHWYQQNSRATLDALAEFTHESESETTESTVEPDVDTLQTFVDWLAQNQQYDGAAYLVELHGDRVIQRRQGHVKQCFAGVFRFLQMHPGWIQRLAIAVTDADGIHDPDDQLLSDWKAHLAEHADDGNPLYSYTTLRGILRPSLGGILSGKGGGASGTLKRVWPLVAKFLSQKDRLMTLKQDQQ